MYRVLLRSDKICIKIKESVQVHTTIKKGSKIIYQTVKSALINGEAFINSTSEFFIAKRDPTFQIQIILLLGDLKKIGGIVQIQLTKYPISFSNRVSFNLEKSPLPQSSLQLDFMYMETDKTLPDQDFFDLQELERKLHQSNLQKLTIINESLFQENKQLQQEIFQLKIKNQKLTSENTNMVDEYEDIEESLNQQMIKKQEQKEQSFLALEKEKRKIAEIIDIINESGDANLINQIVDLIEMQKEPTEESK